MNISENTYDKANPTLYKMIFPELPKFLQSEFQVKNFSINLNSVNLPGFSLSEQEMTWMGGKIKYPDARISINPISGIFLIDEEFLNWKLFCYWMFYINNNKDKYVENLNNFTCDSTLICYDNWFSREILKIKFLDVWPNNLGDVQLTTKTDGSETLDGNISFSLLRCEILN